MRYWVLSVSVPGPNPSPGVLPWSRQSPGCSDCSCQPTYTPSAWRTLMACCTRSLHSLWSLSCTC